MHNYREFFKQNLLMEAILGLLVFAMGVAITYGANLYTLMHNSNPVTDLILDNIPVFEVNFIYSYGALTFAIILTVLLLHEPRRIPFVTKAIGLFLVIRSLFMVLTHVGPPEPHSYFNNNDILFALSSGNDLFFSQHTGLPFMLGFVFWHERFLRYFFFFSSFVGGTSVLLGHLHYSIDVFSALFIGFGIYCISKMIFRKDYNLLESTRDFSE